MRQWKWVKIAGRGKLGNANWGADFDRSLEELKGELAELKKHTNEVVLLTGGGGGACLAVLKGALLTSVGTEDKPALTARLENLTPKVFNGGKFSPYIDSWQISVAVEV